MRKGRTGTRSGDDESALPGLGESKLYIIAVQVFTRFQLSNRNGNVKVFYCDNSAVEGILRNKCADLGLSKRESLLNTGISFLLAIL